jgi:alkanesulfonate monooxygenase SsuD/methylene tetrahydromethanopterin reductase-like flavin-dependent oxidoreductase (luciferase family)
VATQVPLHLAIALEGAGWHPAAWRFADVPARAYFGLRYWAGLAAEAEAGLVDFVTFDDALAVQSPLPVGGDDRTDLFRGRFDAVQLAASLSQLTEYLGFVPAATTTHTEPFHVSTAIATLDFVSNGRAGWQVCVSRDPDEARNVGRRVIPEIEPPGVPSAAKSRLRAELYREAGDFVEVARRLWDSWEDDAVIRDLPTGRYLDRDRLHHIDFTGNTFAVKGPSVVPRPPQGQPPVALLAHEPTAFRLAARCADIAYVTPADDQDAGRIVAALRAAEAEVDRREPPLKILADLVVFLGADGVGAEDRKRRWDDLAGAPRESDATVFTGTPRQLRQILLSWQAKGIDGVRLRPGSHADDVPAITRGLIPELRAHGAFRTAYRGTTLRDRFGLSRPVNRYATV